MSTNLDQFRTRAEAALEEALPPSDVLPARLHEAMRYAALGGGKRMRPLLVYASGSLCDADLAVLDKAAAAIELIHCYSLAHDDLPAMDNDDLRRGRPTCHKQYDEATAILVGDALQSLAFEVIAEIGGLHGEKGRQAELALRMSLLLANASGSRGMAGGQMMDISATGKTLDLPALELLHIHKTGRLIRASVELGAIAGGVAEGALYNDLLHFGERIGLAFQIWDDVLDETGTTEEIGKTAGSDRAGDKASYVTLLGLADAKRLAEEQLAAALDALRDHGERAEPLREIAHMMVRRKH